MNISAITIIAAIMGSTFSLDASPAEAFSPKTLQAIACPANKAAFSTDWIPLGLKAADLQEKVQSPGHITDVGVPEIKFSFPAGWSRTDKRAALCVFPGGGYSVQAIEKEGTHIADWAATHGMVGITVKYRVSQSNNAMGQFPGPLLDARQALRIARKYAGVLGINPRQIGVIGFSAGGHLSAMSATLWHMVLPEEEGNPLRTVSARPDFAMMVYPVITMTPGITSSGTRSKILGTRSGDEKMVALCSTERQVTAKTPPILLVYTEEDPVASRKNDELMAEACRRNNVSVSMLGYPTGGHGFGMVKRGAPSDQWPDDAAQWLRERHILPPVKP